MADKTIIHYEQLQEIAKRFEAEGDEMTQFLIQTRQKVHDTQSEWIGLASHSFFDDMENKVLPSLQRLCESLFSAARTTQAIMAIYQHAEDEGSSPFRLPSGGIGLTSPGVGAGQPGGLQGGLGAAAGASATGGATSQGSAASGANQPGPLQGSSAGSAASFARGGGSAGGGGGRGASGLQESLNTSAGAGASQASRGGGASGAVQGGGSSGIPDHLYGDQSGASPQPLRSASENYPGGSPQPSRQAGTAPSRSQSAVGGTKGATGKAGVAAGGAKLANHKPGKMTSSKRGGSKRRK